MDQALFALSMLPVKTGATRAFLQEVQGSRIHESAACGQSAGIDGEVWAVPQAPQADLFVADITGANIAVAFKQFTASESEFDRWFKQPLQETTGADLNTPHLGPSVRSSPLNSVVL